MEPNIQSYWTTDAINCWELHHNCKKCFLAKVLETPCLMHITVTRLINTIGTPEQAPRKPFTPYATVPNEEEIISRLQKTGVAEAAKSLNLSVYKLNSLMKKYNINGSLMKWKRKKKNKISKVEKCNLE